MFVDELTTTLMAVAGLETYAPGGWDFRFAPNDAVKGWEQICSAAASNARTACWPPPAATMGVPAAAVASRNTVTGRDRSRCPLISCDIDKEGDVTDILIRDIPDEVLVAIDAKAKRLGLSRTAYLRRALERERSESSGPVTVDTLKRLASLTADLDDLGVMSDAWS